MPAKEVKASRPRAESPGRASERKEPSGAEQDGGQDKSKVEAKGLMNPQTAVKVAVAGVALYFLYAFVGSKVDVKGGLEQAVAFVEAQGATAVYWYCAFTFLGVVCLVPTTPMEVAGGFIFYKTYGAWVYVFTGGAKLCANVVSVLIAKYLVRDYVMEHVVKKSELLTMVASAVKDEPWKMAFLVRGSMVPLFVKNYGLGVTDIGYLPNACCSMIFTNFYAAQNIYMGSTMSNLKEAFAPKKAADPNATTDWFAMGKKLMPIAFNVLLVICLVKALKSQMKKQKAEIEKKLKEKGEKKKD